jgi:hypothetical protein
VTDTEKIDAAVLALRSAVVAADLRECADYIDRTTREGKEWTVPKVVEMLRNRAELLTD